VLHTGGLHPRKNLSRLLAAYAEVRKRRAAPPLVIAGDMSTRWGGEVVAEAQRLTGAGGEVPALRTRAGAEAPALPGFPLRDVIFPGHVGDAILPALYRAAAVAVYPSLYEGFGLPILEAMASGAPVITSNRSSMAEVAGDAAVLVDPESVEELAGALGRVLSEERLRQELRTRGLSRSRQFTWERTARETVAVYRRFARGR
jgi:glycosyltransferase involved in cell wall biosynthesis